VLFRSKGRGSAIVPTVLGLPVKFPSVAAGTAAASNVVPITIQNTGDAPLVIATGNNAVQIQSDQGDAGDFAVVSQNCAGATLPAGQPANGLPRGTCVVNVGFKPTKTGYTSVARLRINANADDATETVLLAGTSTNDANVGVGGTVPGVLSLNVPGSVSFGAFTPGIGRNYDVTLAATVTSTAGDAALTVTDSGATAAGHLVNGSDALDTPLALRGAPASAYQSLGAAPLALKSWSGPVTNEAQEIGLRQQIGANEGLRAGTYSKTLTFTLSTTTP